MFLKRLTLLLICLCLLAACKRDNKTAIIGLWQEVALHNHQMDSALENQHRFLDTVGYSTDSAMEQLLYGTDNIDTFRHYMLQNIDSFKLAQGKAVSETWFDFHKNGVVFLHSLDGLDSAKWYLDDDGALMLDEDELKGGGAKIRMEINRLDDTSLRLSFKEQYLNSTADFRRVVR